MAYLITDLPIETGSLISSNIYSKQAVILNDTFIKNILYLYIIPIITIE
jgi:hypothetical protein